MSRLPIRLRLTMAFAVAVAVVLAVTGASIYVRFESDLSSSVDQGLRARAQDLAATIRRADGALNATRFRLLDPDEVYAQVLRPDGSVADASPSLHASPVLSAPELAKALAGQTLAVDRRVVPGQDGPSRALGTPIALRDGPAVLIVGVTLSDRNEAVASLRTELLIGGPIALLVLSVGGYLMSRAALGPIDAMRRRAEALSSHAPDARLPVAAANDEVRDLGVTLNAMLDRLHDAFLRERRLLTDAGHELRTPLALLTTELEVALREDGSPEDLRESIRSALEETDRLSRLAENLLAFTGSDDSDAGRPALPVDAAATARVVHGRFTPAFARAGRTLSVVAPAGQWVRADPLQLEQVLQNLLDNALHHGAGATLLEVRTEGGRVLMRVTDTGPGIPAALIPHAFEPFARANDARSRPGAGLGLAIVRRIAEGWDGTAAIANLPDGGAEVRVMLPAMPEPD